MKKNIKKKISSLTPTLSKGEGVFDFGYACCLLKA